MSKFQIRKTSNQDLVNGLHKEIFPDDELYTETDGVQHWIVWKGAFPVGFCTVRNIGSGIAYLARAGLLSSVRGRGLHKRMVIVRERWARRMGLKQVITYVVPNNTASLRSLIKRGYEPYDPEYKYVGGEFLYLTKYLPKLR